MQINCTKKLLDHLKITPELSEEESPLFSWHANLLTINRRKTVVLVNDQNRYTIVLWGLKAKDFLRLDKLVLQAIQEIFAEELISDEVIEQFLKGSGEIVYTKTRNRSLVARMNKGCDMVYYKQDKLTSDSIVQTEVSIAISEMLVGDGRNDFFSPNEKMLESLQDMAGQPVVRCQAAVLKVALDLGKHEVWRRVVVPTQFTFNKLHKVLQQAFGWRDYHLYNFFVYSNEKSETYGSELYINHPASHRDRYQPILEIVYDEEAFEYQDEIPAKLARDVRLGDVIPAPIKYIYDFGDNWQHYIEVEEIISDFDKNHPICLAGEGNTPPEDVGGEYGYQEFLDITGNKQHPEYRDMMSWARGQGYQDFDIDKANRILKYI